MVTREIEGETHVAVWTQHCTQAGQIVHRVEDGDFDSDDYAWLSKADAEYFAKMPINGPNDLFIVLHSEHVLAAFKILQCG